ncbi:MAG: YfiR family protein [Polyangiaceae bacterium]
MRRRVAYSFLLVMLLAALVPLWSVPADAEESSAPATVQAQIMARLLPFDRNFASKVKADVVIVLLEKPGNSDSSSAVKQIAKALSDVGKIGGHPVTTMTIAYSGAAAAVATCKAKGAHAVYVAPGLGSDIGALAASLAGSGIVSFSAVESYVAGGASVGVSIVSGKPQMSINLAKARAQRIDFPATVLKLAKVY